MPKLTKTPKETITSIKVDLSIALDKFSEVENLGPINSERLVEAKAGIIRAKNRLKLILNDGEKK